MMILLPSPDATHYVDQDLLSSSNRLSPRLSSRHHPTYIEVKTKSFRRKFPGRGVTLDTQTWEQRQRILSENSIMRLRQFGVFL